MSYSQWKNGEFLEVTAQSPDIVTPPTLHDQVVYTDEFMGQFEREKNVDSSRRESFELRRTKSLGRFEDIVRRESCSLCSLFADIPKRFGFVSDNMQSVLDRSLVNCHSAGKRMGGNRSLREPRTIPFREWARIFARSYWAGYLSSCFQWLIMEAPHRLAAAQGLNRALTQPNSTAGCNLVFKIMGSCAIRLHGWAIFLGCRL